MKRIISLCLILVVLFSVLSMTACQNTKDPSDSSGEATTSAVQSTEPEIQPDPDDPDYTYIVSDGKAQITGYKGTSTDLVIPSWAGGVPVTSLASMLFMNNTTIESVVIPGCVEDTGTLSFYNCSALKKVVLSEGMTRITVGTFDDCALLGDVTLPSTLTSIEDLAFQGCTALKQITLPDGLTHLGFKCFGTCSLEDVTIPASCTSLEPSVFKDNRSLKHVKFLADSGNIPDNFFECCFALESAELPANMESIGNYAFSRCESLTTLDIGTANYICTYAFWGCLNLESINFHTTKMNRLCEYVFTFVPKLTDIYYAGTEDSWINMRKFDPNNDALAHITIHYDWNF